MRIPAKSRYRWLRLALVLGASLGLLLLAQSLISYSYVSSRMVVNELRRDANKQVVFLERHIRQMGTQDAAQLVGLLDEIRKEGERKIAWIRVTGLDGAVLAQSGDAVGAPFRREQLRTLLQQREEISVTRDTPSGKVLVTVLPLRLRRGPGANVRLIEIALYLEGARGTFWPLRRNLIISCSAALALVASMILLAVRFGSYVRGMQLEQQMNLARQVQQDLLPSSDLSVEGLDVAAVCVPAWQVGGDFYDVFLADERRVALLLGDVSGKGLPAALLMGLLHGAMRSSVWVGTPQDHEAALVKLNELLRTKSSRERFVSMFSCYYDPGCQLLRYVNAGHPPPLLFRLNGDAGWNVERLDDGGPVIGLLTTASYTQSDTRFDPDDLLVLYSDGVVEAVNDAGEEFGEDRLCETVRRSRGLPCESIRDAILGEVRAFLGGEQAQDDLTVLVVRMQPAGTPAAHS